jgi:hypothetical protein
MAGGAVQRAAGASPARPNALRPGELDGLVLEHVRSLDAAVGPTAVGKALDRSAGAVANCMTRLVKAGQLKQTNKRPRRYKAA